VISFRLRSRAVAEKLEELKIEALKTIYIKLEIIKENLFSDRRTGTRIVTFFPENLIFPGGIST